MIDKTAMQSPKLNFNPRGLFIGGRWVAPADDKSFVSINPSNMEKLADVPSASETDVDRAVKAAKAAFKDWSRLPIKQRARCLERLADRIEENADELALIDAVDSGNAIVGMRGDMTWTRIGCATARAWLPRSRARRSRRAIGI